MENNEQDQIEKTRSAVLEALDSTVEDGKAWIDSDLSELFHIIDKIARRNFQKMTSIERLELLRNKNQLSGLSFDELVEFQKLKERFESSL